MEWWLQVHDTPQRSYSAWALDLSTDAGVPAGSEAPPTVEAGDLSELMKLIKYLFSLT
jgi:hypothetical protein